MGLQKRLECTLCHVWKRYNHMRDFSFKIVCAECVNEYRKIFYGKQTQEQILLEKCPEFRAFKSGWEDAERAGILKKKEIPKNIIEYYTNLLLDKRKDTDEPKA